MSKIMPKNLKAPLFLFSIIFGVYLVSKLTKSNWAEVEYRIIEEDSVGGNGGEIPAILTLNKLVEENFLNRNYYEASSFHQGGGPTWYANYNMKHQALFIGMSDGWSYCFYATRGELKMITERKIPAYMLHQFLKPFPLEYLSDIPTRSRDLFSFF